MKKCCHLVGTFQDKPVLMAYLIQGFLGCGKKHLCGKYPRQGQQKRIQRQMVKESMSRGKI